MCFRLSPFLSTVHEIKRGGYQKIITVLAASRKKRCRIQGEAIFLCLLRHWLIVFVSFCFSLLRINLLNCYGWTHSFDVWHSCSLYVNLCAPLYPLDIQFFEEHFYMELSHRPFPPLSRAQSNELPSNEPRCIIKAHAISRFLGLELRCSWRKAFNYELHASPQQQALRNT